MHEQPLPSADSEERPDDREVREELARILSSRLFEQVSQASRLLKFVVEESLAGRGAEIRGQTIAANVFDQSGDLGAQADPLVRSEAVRLQRRLAEYYLGEGRDNPVRIALPRAGFVPRIEYAGLEAARGGFHQAPSKRFVSIAVLGSLAVLTTALIIWYSFLVSPTVTAPALGGVPPRVYVAPLTSLSEDQNVAFFAEALTEEIIVALVDFGIVGVASSPEISLNSNELTSVLESLDTSYVLAGTIRSVEDLVRVSIRVMDARNGAQLWTTSFDESANAVSDISIQERIALEIAMLVTSPYGPVYANEMELYSDRPVDSLNGYECLIRFYEYAVSFDPALHADSRRCLLRVTQADPEDARAWSALSVVHLHEHNFGYNPLPESGEPLARAIEAARKSLDIDGSGRVAAIALMGIRFAGGNKAEFERATDRALSIQPPHPAVLAQIGFLRTIAGDWQTGIPLLDDAVALTANLPGWFYAAYTLRYLSTGDYDEALQWALRTDAPEWFMTPLTTAASAALAGRTDIAEREAARLLELYPDFPTAGRRQLARWGMDESLANLLLDGAAKAGIRAH